MTLTLGTTLGPYSVTAKIGEGGMGEVYRARDRKLDRDVALIGDFRHRLRRIGELGAIFITVAIALLGLLVFSSFTIDHGLRMVACGQSKTAADAGALAAALYLAWDDPSGDLAGAQAIAVTAAQENPVGGGGRHQTCSHPT